MASENIGLVDATGRPVYRRESLLIGQKGEDAVSSPVTYEESEQEEMEPEEAKLKMSEDALNKLQDGVQQWHQQKQD